MKNLLSYVFIALAIIGTSPLYAEDIRIDVHAIDSRGVGAVIGTIHAGQSPFGVVLTPALSGLSPGLHGFHIHQKASCAPAEKGGKSVAGLSAGGHYDPDRSGRHDGPYGNGHRGDLPALYVDSNGRASHPVLAPRVDLSDLKGRALIIHAGGDNYSDQPRKLGGGGARVACGVAAP